MGPVADLFLRVEHHVSAGQSHGVDITLVEDVAVVRVRSHGKRLGETSWIQGSSQQTVNQAESYHKTLLFGFS